MANEKTERIVFVKPGQSATGKTGENLSIIIPSPRCVVDGHSHIENGACAPLPLLWDKNWLIRGKEREEIDTMSTKGIKGLLFKILKGQAGIVQVKSTAEIGSFAVSEQVKTFNINGTIGQSDLYKNSDLFTLLVIMMMDMEYAHIAGYSGQTIYHDDETPWYYYKRKSGALPEKNGTRISLPGENQKTFSKWESQLCDTIEAMKLNPLRLIGMYHYDPRRWNFTTTTAFDRKKLTGPWNYPFNEIATPLTKGLFIGFKVYPSLGFKPFDERLPYMHDNLKGGDCFYDRCEREGIPILSHCSPGGMTTHELPYYMELDKEVDSGKQGHYPQDQQNSYYSTAPGDATATSIDKQELAVSHFYYNYVHPRAWRNVLHKFSKLKLCLAHFGGDNFPLGLGSDWVTEIIDLTKTYDNVYTDVSCWNFDKSKKFFEEILTNGIYGHLQDKILFGTDWYMTLVALSGKSYKKFCEEFWEFFEEMPGGRDLWIRLTFLNPFEFYGFNETTKMDNLCKALKDTLKNATAENAKCDKNYQHFLSLQKEFNKQREKLKKFKRA